MSRQRYKGPLITSASCTDLCTAVKSSYKRLQLHLLFAVLHALVPQPITLLHTNAYTALHLTTTCNARNRSAKAHLARCSWASTKRQESCLLLNRYHSWMALKMRLVCVTRHMPRHYTRYYTCYYYKSVLSHALILHVSAVTGAASLADSEWCSSKQTAMQVIVQHSTSKEAMQQWSYTVVSTALLRL
jgi:hypothetical protein